MNLGFKKCIRWLGDRQQTIKKKACAEDFVVGELSPA
jgi:hypothetical protein